MAIGINSRVNLTAATNTTVATTPASGKAQILTFSLANRTTSEGTFNLAVVNNGTTSPSAGDYIEYQTPVTSRGTFERTGIIIQNGQTLVCNSSVGGSAVTYGLEDTPANTNTGAFKFNLSSGVNTTVTTGPSSGRYMTVNISLCNTSATFSFIRIFISANASSPATTDYIEYDVPLGSYGILERTGIVVGNGQQIGVYASGSGVSCVAFIVDDA